MTETAKEAVQDMLSFLGENKMRPVEASYQTWRANHKGEICVVQLSFPGEGACWTVAVRLNHIHEYMDTVEGEELDTVILDNIVYCVFGKNQPGTGCNPSKPCILGESRKVLGKEIDGICVSSTDKFTRIWNPSEEAIRKIKRLLKLEQAARNEHTFSPAPKTPKEPKQVDPRLKIEDAARFMQGERLQNLLEFASWLKESKLSPTWVRTTVSSQSKIWKVKNICSIKVKYDGPNKGAWVIEFGIDDNDLALPKDIADMVRSYANTCKDCEGCCLPKPVSKVCGIEIARLCCFPLEFWNPAAETLYKIKQLITAKIGGN